jgi:ectoine hydroxylase-related dioxygenase (phytanoyl-CoA dioxygenase family)
MPLDIPVIRSPNSFRTMHEANALLLADKAALWRQFDRDGYLFFRNVLDPEPVRRLQSQFAAELARQGLIKDDDNTFLFTNKDLSNVRTAAGALLPVDALHERQPWREFTSHPRIHGFIKDLIGEEPCWVPIVEHKAVPPSNPSVTRFNLVHQDSFFNRGIQFFTCWIPLSEIDADAGGLAVAEGMHKGSYHNVNDPPAFFIPQGAIPDSAWVRADYSPGDLVLFHQSAPHSGLTNHSDRFRLSMDVRFVPKSKNPPIVGKLISATTERIVVQSEDGHQADVVIDENTTFRNHGLGLVERSNIAELYRPGDELIVSAESGRATVVRRTSAGAYITEVAATA